MFRVEVSMSPIFISYRRSDDARVGRISDALEASFGRTSVFRDIGSIAGGADFTRVLDSAIQESSVVLVAIGPDWSKRLAQPDDFVRREVAAALEQGKKVVPMLLDDTPLPTIAELPPDLHRLVSYHAARVRGGEDFTTDMERLARAIEELTKELGNHRVAVKENTEALRWQAAVGPGISAAVAVALGCWLLYVMLSRAETLTSFGIVGNFWFVLLVALGVAAAIAIFSSMKSYARYSGKVLSGTLELGGPVVVFFGVIVAGHLYVKEPLTDFAYTVFVHGPAGEQDLVLRKNGAVMLRLNADPRIEAIGDKGEARFVGIPANLRDAKVIVGVDAAGYELKEPSAKLKLQGSYGYVAVQPKAVTLEGTVFDTAGQPIAKAGVVAGDQSMDTDENGRFRFVFRDASGSAVDVVVSSAGFAVSRSMGTPGAGPMQVQLKKLR